jgi:hypothetical protein
MESTMFDTILNSSRDTLLVAVPCVALMLVGLLRLDERIARPRKSPGCDAPALGLGKQEKDNLQ